MDVPRRLLGARLRCVKWPVLACLSVSVEKLLQCQHFWEYYWLLLVSY